MSTVRNLGDLKPHHFKDPTNYRVIPKYLDKYNKKFNAFRQQKCQLHKKVETLKDLLSDLHSKGLISEHAAKDLKVS